MSSHGRAHLLARVLSVERGRAGGLAAFALLALPRMGALLRAWVAFGLGNALGLRRARARA
ncbi:MAG: hypothetical protein R3A48_19675 [Polyangiales bacterium]